MIKLSEIREYYQKISNILIIISGFTVFVSLIILIGFYLSDFWLNFFTIIIDIILYIFIFDELIKLTLSPNFKEHIKNRKIEILILLFLLLEFAFSENLIQFIELIFPGVRPQKIALIYLVLIEISILTAYFAKFVRASYRISNIRIHSSAIIAISFLTIILFGSFLLMLPKSYNPINNYNYLDALFTSTSAVCVTGLIVKDTATQFTNTGKLFILMLIQIGGIGIMTLTTFFAFYVGAGVSLKVRSFVKDMFNEDNFSLIRQLIKNIFIYTITIELIGAILLYFAIVKDISSYDPNILYLSIFHSVSAFCNAGFSLYSDNLANNLTANNYLYLNTIMALIVLGGLGFIVHVNLLENLIYKIKGKRINFRIHTKIVLISTSLLIITGTLLIYNFDNFSYGNNLSIFDKLYHSLFLSISSRTAGFNIIPTETLSNATIMVLILLMWIGASPGSTGGGIKTTTLSVALITLFSFVRGKTKVEIFRREVSPESIKSAFLVIISSISILGFASTLLVWLEPNFEPLDLIFEATSAISTVGLSRNISFYLGSDSKILIILLMFIGRIGVLAFITSLIKPQKDIKIKYPMENILVG